MPLLYRSLMIKPGLKLKENPFVVSAAQVKGAAHPCYQKLLAISFQK